MRIHAVSAWLMVAIAAEAAAGPAGPIAASAAANASAGTTRVVFPVVATAASSDAAAVARAASAAGVAGDARPRSRASEPDAAVASGAPARVADIPGSATRTRDATAGARADAARNDVLFARTNDDDARTETPAVTPDARARAMARGLRSSNGARGGRCGRPGPDRGVGASVGGTAAPARSRAKRTSRLFIGNARPAGTAKGRVVAKHVGKRGKT